MATRIPLDREESVEQAYFFRALRERLAQNLAAQEVLLQVHEEILATTRLPMAVQFLATELKHTGLLSTGFAKLPHYFTGFQTLLIRQTEQDTVKFDILTALLVLEREASYRAGGAGPAGLFVYDLEVLCRNRLGYDEGLAAVATDPAFDPDWQEYLGVVRRQLGVVEVADLIYLRSALYPIDQRRLDPAYEQVWAPLFGEKEGRIAKANRGRDPLYLFAALQRQLGYPEVPRPATREDVETKLATYHVKIRELDQRVRLLEDEARGKVDLGEYGKPELFDGPWPGDVD